MARTMAASVSLSAVSLSDRSLSAATATISLARTVASGYRGAAGTTLTFDCNLYSINHRAEARVAGLAIGHHPYIRDEEILDSIKTHVLKKVARIGRFGRFTWRVRC
jgi:hypothetical protein